MAAFAQHQRMGVIAAIAVGLLGRAGLGLDFSVSIVAGILTYCGSLFPDLDAPVGRPARESLPPLAAVLSLFVYDRVATANAGRTADGTAALAGALVAYFLIRHVGAWLLRYTTIHRGMFHSLPTLGIAGGLVFAAAMGRPLSERVYFAVAAAFGMVFHFALDRERGPLRRRTIYGTRYRRTPFKWFGADLAGNILAWGMLVLSAFLVYLTMPAHR